MVSYIVVSNVNGVINIKVLILVVMEDGLVLMHQDIFILFFQKS